MKAQGTAWINTGNDSDDYWAEGIKCDVVVEATDSDEIRLGVMLTGETHEDAGVYLSRKEADRLSRFLAAASVAEVEIPVA